MNLREIPTIESAGRLGRRPDPESALQDAYAAERVLAADPIGSMALGAALGSAELLRDRVFPSATQLADMQRAAAAAAYTYHSSCYNNYSGPCDSPCYGFPPHQMSSWYCATCD